MAAAALLRSAARSLRLRQPLEQGRFISEGRFLSSSVPSSETRKCFPSSDPHSRPRGCMEKKSHVNSEKKEEVYQRISAKIDRISAELDEYSRLLNRIKENEARRGAVGIPPWVVSFSATLCLFALYYAYPKG